MNPPTSATVGDRAVTMARAAATTTNHHRPLRWLGERGLPLALSALALAAVLPLVVLWDQLPREPTEAPPTPATAPKPTTVPSPAGELTSATVFAADRLGHLLREALRCAMNPQVQPLGPGATQLAAASLATLTGCVGTQAGLSQIFLPATGHPLSAAPPVTQLGEQPFGQPDVAYQQAVAEAVRTGTTVNRLIPAGTSDDAPGVDLIVPPRDAQSPPLMVLRLRWPRLLQDAELKARLAGLQVRLLADDTAGGSGRREGLSLSNAAGVRIVLGPSAPAAAPTPTATPTTTAPLLRWLLALVMLATLGLAAATVYGMGRAHRRHQQQLQTQVQALQEKERQLEADQRRITDMNERLRNQSAVYLLGTRAGELLHKMQQAAGACTRACSAVHKNFESGRLEKLHEGLGLASTAALEMKSIVQRFEPWLRAEPVLEPVSLHEVASAALEQQAELARSHSVPTFNTVSPALPRVHADRVMLVETLSNLVKNAIQAMVDAPEVNRNLLLSCRYDDTLEQLRLQVQDRGCGIPKSLWEQIFDQGFRGRATGSGWGLFVCRQWLERMGGSLQVLDSKQGGPDSGTCMVMTLPLSPAQKQVP